MFEDRFEDLLDEEDDLELLDEVAVEALEAEFLEEVEALDAEDAELASEEVVNRLTLTQ